jgi:hypothetical protein
MKTSSRIHWDLQLWELRSWQLRQGKVGNSGKGESPHIESCHKIMASEDWKKFMCAVVTVNFGVCYSARLLFIIMSVSVQQNQLAIQTLSTVTQSCDKLYTFIFLHFPWWHLEELGGINMFKIFHGPYIILTFILGTYICMSDFSNKNRYEDSWNCSKSVSDPNQCSWNKK